MKKINEVSELQTQRLKLRQWVKEDFQPFAAMSADPQVMAFYPSTLSEEESNVMAMKIQGLIAERGWGFWAVETLDSGAFVGFVGLHIPTYDLPCSPCVEIGWRLARPFWGKGYATEAAKESLAFAFEKLELNEVYSFASQVNERSWRVMERLGMVNTGQNFDHPIIPKGHALSEHVLYRIMKEQWLQY